MTEHLHECIVAATVSIITENISRKWLDVAQVLHDHSYWLYTVHQICAARSSNIYDDSRLQFVAIMIWGEMLIYIRHYIKFLDYIWRTFCEYSLHLLRK